MDTKKTVGARLNALRVAAGLSLRKASSDAGVSVTWLCRMENDRIANPRVGNLRILAEFYGVPLVTILNGD